MPPDPVLIDIVKDGKKIPALVQTGKSGYMFILDRVTGKPVFGVEERPVAQGNAPGEWYAATQPFPLKPPPLARVSISRADIVTADDTSADHAKACQELWDKRGLSGRGAVRAVDLSGRRHAAARDHQSSWADRRNELGRRDGRSGNRLRVREFARQSRNRLAKE